MWLQIAAQGSSDSDSQKPASSRDLLGVDFQTLKQQVESRVRPSTSAHRPTVVVVKSNDVCRIVGMWINNNTLGLPPPSP